MKLSIKYYLILAISFLASFRLSAQELSIQGSLDKAEIKTGEQAAVNLTIRTNQLEELLFNLSGDGKYKGFEVLELGALDTITVKDDLVEVKARLLITSFDSTLVQIPAIVAYTSTSLDSTSTFALNVIQPEVDLTQPDKFMGNKATWQVNLTLQDIIELIYYSLFFRILCIVFLVIILSLIAYQLYLYKQRKKNNIPTVIYRLTALELFSKRLDELQTKDYLAKEQYKLFFTELIEYFKLFLNEFYAWNTLEETSKEVLSRLTILALNQRDIQEVEQVFELADLVKFAKGQTTKEESQEMTAKLKNVASLMVQLREDEMKLQAEQEMAKDVNPNND